MIQDLGYIIQRKFNILAKILLTSINVDSEIASKEREVLLPIAKELDKKWSCRVRDV